jgi:hypothetical protein
MGMKMVALFSSILVCVPSMGNSCENDKLTRCLGNKVSFRSFSITNQPIHPFAIRAKRVDVAGPKTTLFGGVFLFRYSSSALTTIPLSFRILALCTPVVNHPARQNNLFPS